MGETVGIAISSSYMLASIKLLLVSMIDKTEREGIPEKGEPLRRQRSIFRWRSERP
jgi:hypothetical protein